MKWQHHLRRVSFGLLPLLILCVSGLSAYGGVIFFDDFDGGIASPDWGNERGSWRADGGVYDASAPSNNPVTYSGVTTLTSLTDFVLDVDVNTLDDGGIWLRSDYNSGSINGVLLVTGGFDGSYNGLYWHVLQNGSAGGVQNQVGLAGLQGR